MTLSLVQRDYIFIYIEIQAGPEKGALLVRFLRTLGKLLNFFCFFGELVGMISLFRGYSLQNFI